MQTRLEPRMEALLLDLAPQLGPSWSGVGEEEIARIEAIAGRALPPFYQWFLERFGRGMGPLSYRSLDFSVEGVLAAYADGRVERDPRYLLVAYDHDPAYPSHAFYDLERPCRDDALIVAGEDCDDEDELTPSFETLREMIAWGAMILLGVGQRPQRCVGMLKNPNGDVMPVLDPVLGSMGLQSAVETGRYCGAYRGDGIDFASKSTPGRNPDLQVFDIGAGDTTAIRRLLGEITNETMLELEIDGWDPPVP